ncbi:hypothetical protein PVAP13_1NG060925 [Panicum virgatum]|uniref:Uncharacterized protein n=1 Tax=Panicum virgatum TaxID=38727 RepID=A0A8T0WGK1_PANVG|nr:hypothetical protein PVAP13_1NG060925 [Panicum virgatum]
MPPPSLLASYSSHQVHLFPCRRHNQQSRSRRGPHLRFLIKAAILQFTVQKPYIRLLMACR